jgi:hypothetical protein
MEFTERDQYDVFISYAHADNQPFREGDEGLVTTFVRDLENYVSRKLDRDATIWMDHRELSGNQPLTPAIMGALAKTTVIVVIASPRYLASQWCRLERQKFLELVSQRTSAGSRVFRVEFDKVTRLPDEFKDTIGYKLWLENWKDKTTRTLGFPNHREQEYWDVLNRIATHLADELTRLESAPQAPDPDSYLPPANSKGSVFLADVTDDLDSKRTGVRDYLEQAGLKVFPETWRTYDNLNAFTVATDRDLAQCSVFVQLLSEVAGKKPFNQPYGLPRLQHQRASGAGIKILQWRNNGKLQLEDISDEDHRALIDGPTVRAESIEDFKRAVVASVLPPEPNGSPSPKPSKFVFISADIPDRSLAKELIIEALEKRGISYAMLPNSNDTAITRRFMEVSLTDCDAALVIYCVSDSASVLAQVLQCRKHINQRQPLRIIAVYDGPPPPDMRDELTFNFPNLVVLNCRTGQEALDQFLDTL